MRPLDETSDSWQPCAPGQLAHLAARLDAHHRLRRGKQLINRAVAGMVVAAAVLLAANVYTRGPLAPLRCAQCQMHFAEYRLYQTGEQPMDDAELVERMAAHLAHCDRCRGKFLAAYPGAKFSAAAWVRGYGVVAATLLQTPFYGVVFKTGG